jgi:hypothetical protein
MTCRSGQKRELPWRCGLCLGRARTTRHADLIRRAPMRRRGQGRQREVAKEPDERLVLVACLTSLKLAYSAVLHAWSSEVFAAITDLSESIVGIFLGKKAG